MAVITISRQYGTGGIAIAQKISEKLGYSFMYIDELVAACRERGLDIDLERIEGSPPNLVDRLFGLNREKVRETIREVMEEAAQAGNAESQFKLAGLYQKGLGVPLYIGRSRELLISAAQQGHAEAIESLKKRGIEPPPIMVKEGKDSKGGNDK